MNGLRRVVLVGFMGSGKTTVGRILAARIGWRHVDVDERVEREVGRSVAEIFATGGEAAFRPLEAAAAARALREDGAVVTPGGGWAVHAGFPDGLPPGTLAVWLRADADELLRRVGRAGAEERPLLRGPDPASTVRALLREREPVYARAEIVIETDGRPPDEVAAALERIVRSRF